MKQKFLLKLLFFLLFGLAFTVIKAESPISGKIDLFSISDFNRNSFYIGVKIENDDTIKKFQKDGYQSVPFNLEGQQSGKKTPFAFVRGSLDLDGKNASYQVFGMETVNAGEIEIILKPVDSNTILSNFKYTIPDKKKEVNEQPIIEEISPLGGAPGDTITIRGRNFGKDIDSILLQILSMNPYRCNEYDDYIFNQVHVNYLTVHTASGREEVKFVIPAIDVNLAQDAYSTCAKALKIDTESVKNNLWERYFGKKVKIRLMAGFRHEADKEITILPLEWRRNSILLSVFVSFLFILSIGIILKKFNYLPIVILDTKTNTYSLAKFQAFLWTIVLLGCYFYVAICTAGILQTGKLPDFRASLIVLLGISYSGMIASGALDNREKNKKKNKQGPQMSDLFMKDGEVDLARLQLFGFTIIAILVYIYNLIQANVLEGLPEIPETLQALLLTSQGGYIGGKLTAEKKKVNYTLAPDVVNLKEENVSFQLVGNNFIEGMKVLIDGKIYPAKMESPNLISFSVEKFGSAGVRDILLIPPYGENMIVANAFEVRE